MKLGDFYSKLINVEGVVAVDLSRAVGMLSDIFPKDIEVKDVDEDCIVPARISIETAEIIAKRTFLYFVIRLRHIVLPPEIEVVKRKMLYKEYWLVRGNDGKLYVVDTLRGDVEPLETE